MRVKENLRVVFSIRCVKFFIGYKGSAYSWYALCHNLCLRVQNKEIAILHCYKVNQRTVFFVDYITVSYELASVYDNNLVRIVVVGKVKLSRVWLAEYAGEKSLVVSSLGVREGGTKQLVQFRLL